MSNLEENFEGERPELKVTEDIRSYLYDTARWAKFLSIVGFIFTALMVLVAFSMGAVTSSTLFRDSGNMFGAIGGTTLTVMMLLYALLFFYPSLLLFKFASSAIQGVLYGDQAAFTNSMAKLKSCFKFWGIVTIVGLSFYALAIVMMVATSSMM